MRANPEVRVRGDKRLSARGQSREWHETVRQMLCMQVKQPGRVVDELRQAVHNFEIGHVITARIARSAARVRINTACIHALAEDDSTTSTRRALKTITKSDKRLSAYESRSLADCRSRRAKHKKSWLGRSPAGIGSPQSSSHANCDIVEANVEGQCWPKSLALHVLTTPGRWRFPSTHASKQAR